MFLSTYTSFKYLQQQCIYFKFLRKCYIWADFVSRCKTAHTTQTTYSGLTKIKKNAQNAVTCHQILKRENNQTFSDRIFVPEHEQKLGRLNTFKLIVQHCKKLWQKEILDFT